MTRPAAEVLEDLLAVALRIERLLIREPDNETVRFYQRLLEKQAKERAPDHTRWVPPLVPGMPDPPIAPVRPQTTTVREGTGWVTPPRGYMHPEIGWIHK